MGARASSTLPVRDSAQRRQLTEPAALMSGLGLRFYEPPIPALLGTVEPDGPAAHAGLRSGDTILAVNGEPVHDFQELQKRVQAHPGQTHHDPLPARRPGAQPCSVTPWRQRCTTARPSDASTSRRRRCRRTRPSMLRHVNLSLPAAFARANVEAWNMTRAAGAA